MNRRFGQITASLVAVALVSACAPKAKGATEDWPEFRDLPVQTSIDVTEDAPTAAGDGQAECPAGTAIAYIGTPADRQLFGSTISKSIRLAINQHNEANPKCKIEFASYGTARGGITATGIAHLTIDNPSTVAVIGPQLSDEVSATGRLFDAAGLATITPSAGSPSLTHHGWKTFRRGVSNDDLQGPAAAELVRKVGGQRVYVVSAGTGTSTRLARITAESLGAWLVGRARVSSGQQNLNPTVTKILKARPHLVYFAGGPITAAQLVRTLKARGFQGQFIASESASGKPFINRAGPSGQGAYFTCLCAPGQIIPDFANPYTDAYKKAPGRYSVEAYDATVILLTGIDQGNATRKKLLSFVRTYAGQGYSKYYQWFPRGELTQVAVYGYKVDGGKLVSVGVLN